jgi:hypothetical protein
MRMMAAVLCGLLAAAAAQATEVAPGVAVDEQGPAVFLTSPARRVEAREIASGVPRWSSAEAVRPLAAAAGRVLAQADGPAGRLDLVILEALSGRRVAAESMPLPEGVAAPLDEVLGTRFEVRVERSGTQVRLEWTFERRPVRGALLEDDDEGVVRARGAVVVDLRDARFAIAPARPPAEGPPPLPAPLAAQADAGAFRQRPQRMGGLFVGVQETSAGGLLLKRWHESGAPLPDSNLPPGVVLQMGSADGRHVLVSGLVSGAPADHAHAWTVLSLESGAPVASLLTSTAATPFAVAGGRVLVVHPPMGQRTAAGWQEEPRRVEAFDARTGVPAWKQPVRDPAYHGPFPP